jgi:hypothetical protein
MSAPNAALRPVRWGPCQTSAMTTLRPDPVWRLRETAGAAVRELERVCEEVAGELMEAGAEPPFRVESADFSRADPIPALDCDHRCGRTRRPAHPGRPPSAMEDTCLRSPTDEPSPGSAAGAILGTEPRKGWSSPGPNGCAIRISGKYAPYVTAIKEVR